MKRSYMVKPRNGIDMDTKTIHIEFDFPPPKVPRWDEGKLLPNL